MRGIRVFCPLPLHTAHIVWVVGGLWAPLDVLHACCAPTIGGLSRFIFSPMWFWLALTDLYSGIWKNRLTRQRRCRRASFVLPSTPPTLWVFTTRLHATKPGMSIEYLHSDFDQKYIPFLCFDGFSLLSLVFSSLYLHSSCPFVHYVCISRARALKHLQTSILLLQPAIPTSSLGRLIAYE